LPHRIFAYGTDSELFAANCLKRLKLRPRTGLIFDEPQLYLHFCMLKPLEMLEIFRQHRVIVMNRATMRLGSEIPPEVTVDAVLFPWQQLARRIASDLNKGQGTLSSDGPVFEAEWLPRTPLREIVQRNLGE